MSTPAKDKLGHVQLSISIPYFKDLEKYDCTKYLSSVYGDMTQDAELDHNFTILVDLNQKRDDWEDVFKKCGNMKRNAFAAVCKKFFEDSLAGKEVSGKKAAKIEITKSDHLYVSCKSDRVNFAYGIGIESDEIVTNMFLQEMVDIRKKPELNAAPQVNLAKKPHSDYKSVCDHDGPFFTLALYHRHFKGKNEDKAIDLLADFRSYLNYHIKCSKAHIHTRMRKKTEAFKKVMNRANFKEGKKKKKGKK